MENEISQSLKSRIRFAPWVGSAYEQGFNGVRTLLVCESHYGPVHYERPTATTELIKALCFGERHPQATKKLKRHPHYAKIMTAVMGLQSSSAISKAGRRTFWSQVAYYNFIQQFIPKTRDKPKPCHWEQGRDPFVAVLATLQPQLIVCLSKRNGDLVRQLAGDVPVVVVNHPSSGFAYEEVVPAIAKGYQALHERSELRADFIASEQLKVWQEITRATLPSRGSHFAEGDKLVVLAEWKRLMAEIDADGGPGSSGRM